MGNSWDVKLGMVSGKEDSGNCVLKLLWLTLSSNRGELILFDHTVFSLL